jgi:hypothetical protein
MQMLTSFFLKDNDEGIKRAIGKTELFHFEDPESSAVIDLWTSGKKDEAIKMMKEHVLRISTQTSSNT